MTAISTGLRVFLWVVTAEVDSMEQVRFHLNITGMEINVPLERAVPSMLEVEVLKVVDEGTSEGVNDVEDVEDE